MQIHDVTLPDNLSAFLIGARKQCWTIGRCGCPHAHPQGQCEWAEYRDGPFRYINLLNESPAPSQFDGREVIYRESNNSVIVTYHYAGRWMPDSDGIDDNQVYCALRGVLYGNPTLVRIGRSEVIPCLDPLVYRTDSTPYSGGWRDHERIIRSDSGVVLYELFGNFIYWRD
jgi:hypothetical protein